MAYHAIVCTMDLVPDANAIWTNPGIPEKPLAKSWFGIKKVVLFKLLGKLLLRVHCRLLKQRASPEHDTTTAKLSNDTQGCKGKHSRTI